MTHHGIRTSGGLMLGASLAVLALAIAGPTLAQTKSTTAAAAPAATGTVEEIVVTGFRGSLQQALETKKTASVAQDTILAEDMANSPT